MATLSSLMSPEPDCPVHITAEGLVSSMALTRLGLISSYIRGISTTLTMQSLYFFLLCGLQASILGFMLLPPKDSNPVSSMVFMAYCCGLMEKTFPSIDTLCIHEYFIQTVGYNRR